MAFSRRRIRTSLPWGQSNCDPHHCLSETTQPTLGSIAPADIRVLSATGGNVAVKLTVNRQTVEVDAAPDTPLLWVLRDHIDLKGAKFGCGVGSCGACTVLVDGHAIRSCMTPLSAVAGSQILTLEGLSADGSHPVQKAWQEVDVPQCGYCQPGQIMTAVALLSRNPHPTDDQIDTAMNGNLCRCGTYPRIREAIHRAAGQSMPALRD